jgi:hypothetical protein
MRSAGGISAWTRFRVWRDRRRKLRRLARIKRDIVRRTGCFGARPPRPAWRSAFFPVTQRQVDRDFWTLIHRHDWLQYDPPKDER